MIRLGSSRRSFSSSLDIPYLAKNDVCGISAQLIIPIMKRLRMIIQIADCLEFIILIFFDINTILEIYGPVVEDP